MRRILSLALAACLAYAAPVLAADTVSVTHKLGTIQVPVTPKRIAVMDYGTLDSLDAMGVTADYALPQAGLPSFLSQYKGSRYTDVGGLKEFNLETVNAFKPDLIVISGRQQDYYKELSAIAPTMLVETDAADYLGSVKANLDTLGRIFTRQSDIDNEFARITRMAEGVRVKAEKSGLRALILLTNDGKISAYGSGSRFGIIHDVLGVGMADRNIKVGLHGQLVNYEYLSMINPDIIFVVDRSSAIGRKANGARILDNALVNSTNAAKNGRIVTLDPNVWYLSGGGLQSLAKMVEEVDAALP